jgi:hypothetical protein
MEAGFEGDDTYAERLGHFDLAAAFLDEGYECAILWFEFRECMVEGVEFLGVDASGFVRYVEDSFLGFYGCQEFLPAFAADVIYAGIAGQAEEPGFELRGLREAWKGADHFDKNNLGKIFHGVAAVGDGVDEAGHAVLI